MIASGYIYSREELKRLFEAIDVSRRHATRLDGDTFRTLLLILYGAGLRTSEALHLSMRDVDLGDAVLTVRNTKFFKSRLVPVGPQLAEALRTYAERRSERPLPDAMESAFLANRDGTPVRKHNVDRAFAKLLEAAGIDCKDDGRRAPSRRTRSTSGTSQPRPALRHLGAREIPVAVVTLGPYEQLFAARLARPRHRPVHDVERLVDRGRLDEPALGLAGQGDREALRYGHRSPRLNVIASNGRIETASSSFAHAMSAHSPSRSSNASRVRSVGSTSHRCATPSRA